MENKPKQFDKFMSSYPKVLWSKAKFVGKFLELNLSTDLRESYDGFQNLRICIKEIVLLKNMFIPDKQNHVKFQY